MYTRLPRDRIGVVIGPDGKVKREIEERTGTKIRLNSETGEVQIEAGENPLGAMMARDVVNAIARGFSSEKAFRLFSEEAQLQVVDIRDYVGDSENALVRMKGRLIGEGGKVRKLIEETTGASISIYGKTIALIGSPEQLSVAREAVDMILRGAKHSSVFRFLEEKRREMREKFRGF
ncbi:MAG: KH domain-containing protein [Candidatus Hadarchaeales archaeon]